MKYVTQLSGEMIRELSLKTNMDSKPLIIGKWRKYWCDHVEIKPNKQFCCEYTETEVIEDFEFFDIFSGRFVNEQTKMLCEHFPGKVKHMPHYAKNNKDAGTFATYVVEGDILTLIDYRGWIFKFKRVIPESSNLPDEQTHS